MIYKKLAFIVILTIVFAGCGQVKEIFKKESPHEKYLKMLEQSGLVKTELGRAWKDSSESSLSFPVQINLPFKEEIYFFNNRVEANAYRFTAKKGEMISIGVRNSSSNDKLIFIDLFKIEQDDERDYKRIASSDSTGILQEEIDDNGSYLLRVQPELLTGGRVTLTILTAPSLAFPIPGKDSRAIGSIWGDPRDKGARRHEGVDIFARKGTPVTSASDGIVTRVNETKIGGKVVWVNDISKGQNLYYAHLDSQLVSPGKIVKAGDTLGLVGNTGNARFTPSHLHFGIYVSFQGAVDPYPYINNVRPEPKEISLSSDLLGKLARIKSKKTVVKSSLMKNSETILSIDENSPVEIIGVSEGSYFVRTPLGVKGFVKGTAIEDMEKPLRTVQLQKSITLYDSPQLSSSVIASLNPDNTVEVYGKLGNFQYVRNHNYYGWTKEL